MTNRLLALLAAALLTAGACTTTGSLARPAGTFGLPPGTASTRASTTGLPNSVTLNGARACDLVTEEIAATAHIVDADPTTPTTRGARCAATGPRAATPCW